MKISVIIPVYNKIKYLRNILTQLQEQNFSDYECILIDDGSTDGSGIICDKFAESDSRFRVFHIQNGGVSHARNIGLSQAEGEYVTFIDGDDEIHIDYLSNLVNCAEMSGADMIISGLTKCWENSNKKERIIPAHLGTTTLDAVMPDFARVQRYTGIYGFVCSKLIKSELIRNTRFNEKINLAEDLDFFLSLYNHVHLIHFDSSTYYYYTQAAQNSSMLDPGPGVDYYTQLQIQKKIADLITNRGFMNGENEDITNQRLFDYVYYTLFYSETTQIREKCAQIRKLGLPKRISLKGRPFFQKIILRAYMNKDEIVIEFVLKLYRKARMLVRKCRR